MDFDQTATAAGPTAGTAQPVPAEMAGVFVARAPTVAALDRLAAANPYNPFLTPAYATSLSQLGGEVLLLGIWEGERPVIGALAVVQRGRLGRVLSIASAPSADRDSRFWSGLESFCLAERITDLEVATFASPGARIPARRGEPGRVARVEFEWRLQPGDMWDRIGRSHRERIRQAAKQGVVIRRGRDDDMLAQHIALHEASMQRRRDRGELVPGEFTARRPAALLSTGCGELFQATMADGTVLSSLLVIRGESGAYSESSGNSPVGMKIGASHFLRYQTALRLRDEGVVRFYLGGVRASEAGLRAFKEGFGAEAVPMESVSAAPCRPLARRVVRALQLARSDPGEVARTLIGRAERYAAFAADPCEIRPVEPPVPGLVVRRLSDAEFHGLPTEGEGMAAQHRRIREGRLNDAYGAFVDGVQAGVYWLIPAAHDALYAWRTVALRPGEGEITHCVTFPGFRGRGIYDYAIRSLCEVACRDGMHRVFMITHRENAASQRGILRAGFRRVGGIYRHVFDFLGPWAVLTLRGHRWPLLAWRWARGGRVAPGMQPHTAEQPDAEAARPTPGGNAMRYRIALYAAAALNLVVVPALLAQGVPTRDTVVRTRTDTVVNTTTDTVLRSQTATGATVETPVPRHVPGGDMTTAAVLARMPNYHTLTSLIREAGLTPTFEGAAPLTLFAPTDEAFARLSTAQMNHLQSDPGVLKAVLLHHVVNGRLSGNDLLKLKNARTLEGSKVRFYYRSGRIMVNGATIVQPGITTSNGIVHGIDRLIVTGP